MSVTGKVIKFGAAAAVAGVAIKLGYDKYKQKKQEYHDMEYETRNDPIRKYTAFFDRKLVEVEEGPFEGCEIKAFSSKLVLDLSRVTIEKDIYISFDIKGTSLTVIFPAGAGVRTDISNIMTKVTNHLERSEDKATFYFIGKGVASNIEIIPENLYMDDDAKEEFEDYNDILDGYAETAGE